MSAIHDICGLHQARDGELINFMIHVRNDDGSLTVETLYSPSRDEIIELLKIYNLPIQYTLNVIEMREPHAHTILINLEQYEKHLKEKGFRL